jgi:protein ImuA
MSQGGVSERILFLRRRIAAIEARSGAQAARASPRRADDALSRAPFERLLDGLSSGGFAEIIPARPRDAAAGASFAFALALRCGLDHAAFRRNRLNAENVIDSKSVERASSEKPVPTFFASRALAHSRAGVWIVEDMVAAEIGLPYGRGFEAFGLDPKRLVLARARRPRETLWAMEEALKTSGAIVIAETWMAPEAYDLATSRRLLLAARAGGGTGLLLLLRAAGEARRLSSAAHLRFEVGSVPVGRAAAARRLPLPRPPLWRLRIAKARASLLSALGDFDPLAWRDIAFDPEKTVFRHAFPQRLPPPPFDRPNFERRRRESA